MNSKYISDYVGLAEASYADFTGISTITDPKDRENATIQSIINTDSDNPTVKQFAELVTKNYEASVGRISPQNKVKSVQ